MDGIEEMVKGIISAHTAPIPEMVASFASMRHSDNESHRGAATGRIVGKCPRCGFNVTESALGFFCSSQVCRFAMWKDSRFWAAKGKTFATAIAATLLEKRHISFPDLKSQRTGKTYAATIFLTDDGNKTDFKLEFIRGAIPK